MTLLNAISPRDIEDRDEFKAAERFQRTLTPFQETQYGWVCDYGKDKFDRLTKIYGELDNKANEIIKYLGGGAGLFSLAVILNVSAKNVAVIIAAVPSFLLAMSAIALAILARQPRVFHLTPTVKEAFGYATDYGEEADAKAAFVGQWHVACTSIKLAIGVKADQVRAATWFFFAAIASLILPIGVAIKLAW